jgi:hypothetical protein
MIKITFLVEAVHRAVLGVAFAKIDLFIQGNVAQVI